MRKQLTCAARPCASCPYRKDVPSGIWAQDEYDKLLCYDGDIPEQLMKGGMGVFMCHQKDGSLCAGWLATHKPFNLLAMRMASITREIDPRLYDYATDVPVFSSGAEARDHGMRDMTQPGSRARVLMKKMVEKGIAQEGEPE